MQQKHQFTSTTDDVTSSGPLWTEKQVANEIGLAAGTLANARVSGVLGLPFVKLTPGKRGAVRYRKSDVEAWLAERTFNNTQQAFAGAGKPGGAS